MWEATFKVAELYDIRLREVEFSQSNKNNNSRTRIDMLAKCKTPPAGRGLVTAAGVHQQMAMQSYRETSDQIASGVALANLSERWTAGHQEIKLTCQRSTQTMRIPGKHKPKHHMEPVTGTKLWVWDTFLAFLCGVEWKAPNRKAVGTAAQQSLDEIISSPFGNKYADFEMEDDGWVLVKM